MYSDYITKLASLLGDVVITQTQISLSYESGMDKICELLLNSKIEQNIVFFIGNGGSAGVAIHMAADFLKNGGIRTQTFYDPALVTCMGNDYGFEHIFSKPLRMCANKGDLLIAISSSGESSNILNAVVSAQTRGCKVITFSGFKEENSLRQLGDINVYVPVAEYGIVESIHNLILQQVVDEIK